MSLRLTIFGCRLGKDDGPYERHKGDAIMHLTMRHAQDTDIAALCDLMGQLEDRVVDPSEMRNRLELLAGRVDHQLFVCVKNGSVVGLLGFRIRENLEEVTQFGEVSVIVVSSQERGHGIGQYMMQYAERLSEENGCIGTWLVSGLGRGESTHEFYKGLGYEATGYRFVKRNG